VSPGRSLAAALLSAASITAAPAAHSPPPQQPADPDWHIPLAAGEADAPVDAPEYGRLARALAAYEAMRAAGGWPAVPSGAALQPGDRDPRVTVLRDRLRAGGDYAGEMGADPWFYDGALGAALARFQHRHELQETGVLDADTVAELNVPVGERITQLAVAMERWRWLPRRLGERLVWVDLVRQTLEIREAGATVAAMPVIVGHPRRQTPSLTSAIRQIVFNPRWSVPQRIAVEDLLPSQQEDPGFLQRHRIHAYLAGREVAVERIDWNDLSAANFRYRLEQDAGAGNSLGRMKFVMDNPFDIYLHDTPARGLFTLENRTLSSGCLRLSQAETLANYLLAKDRGWAPAATAARLARPDTQFVTLQSPVPVYVVYITAWATPEGEAHFARDVYGRDAAVANALRARAPALPQE
jgi:murein L,D-transpeptidase YcbB/YkuD